MAADGTAGGGLEKALTIYRRLCAVYCCPIPYFHTLDPVSELISSLLLHRTRNAQSSRAFKELRRRFPTWSGHSADHHRFISDYKVPR